MRRLGLVVASLLGVAALVARCGGRIARPPGGAVRPRNDP